MSLRRFIYYVVLGLWVAGLLAVALAALSQLASAQVLSNVQIVNITSNSADITWNTDVAADSYALLGWNGGPRWPLSDPTLTTVHKLHFSGLLPSTTYSPFILRSKNATGVGFYDSALTSNSFTTLTFPAADVATINLKVIGGSSITQGYSAIFGIERGQLSGENITSNSVLSFVGLPANVTVVWPDCDWNDHSCISTTSNPPTMTQYGVSSREQFIVRTNQGGLITPVGNYPITLINKFSYNKPDKTVVFTQASTTFNLNVVAPQQVNWTPPSSFAPIPQLSLWESQMVTYGKKWCGTASNYDQSVSFYDAEYVYRRTQAYDKAHNLTGNSDQWTTCINQAHQVYSQRIQQSFIPGYWVFPFGLYTGGDYNDLHLLTSQKAVNHGMSANRDISYDIGLMREMAYQCKAFRLDQKAGTADWHNQIEQCTDYELLFIDQVIHNTDSGRSFEPFMGGICDTASLIDYYEDGHQDRTDILLAVKALWDWMWLNAWNNAEPNAYLMQYGQYQAGLVQALASPYNLELRGLNLLIAPTGAWLCAKGAGQSYCDQADTVWVGGVTANPGDTVAWSGKQFSQNYTIGFDFVARRSNQALPKLDNPVLIILNK